MHNDSKMVGVEGCGAAVTKVIANSRLLLALLHAVKAEFISFMP